jgi:hypothetical protein
MMFVLGLLVLLGISATLLFASVRRGNEIVERGFEELQDVLAGRSALSFAISRIQDDPSLAEGWNAEWRDGADSAGFRLRLAMRGVFARISATSAGVAPRMAVEADIARMWIPNSPSALVLWGGGDAVLIGEASIDGAVFSSSLAGLGVGPGGTRRHGLDELPAWLRSGLDTTFVAQWQRTADSVFAGSHGMAGTGPRMPPGNEPVRLGPEISVWDRPVVVDSIVCDRCILLAKALRIRKGAHLKDGLIWSHGSLALSGRVDGRGQFLASDTLLLDSLQAMGEDCVFGVTGREAMEFDSIPTGRSTALMGMRKVSGGGMGVVFALGRRFMDRAPVIESDAATRWRGSIMANGTVRWMGRIDTGALLADRLIGIRKDGVLQEGGLEGRLVGVGGRTHLAIPWVGSETGLAGLAYWSFHAAP